MDKNTVSIVIPTFNHWELCHQLLYDISNHNREVYEVIVVDNGSTDSTKLGLDWWLNSNLLNLHVLHLDENIGFLKACNYGASRITGEKLLLVSNDVRIQGHIVSDLERNLNINPKYIYGGKLYTNPTGWNNFKSKVCSYLEGWLLACTVQAWKDIGGFDELYAPNDMEDVDFSTTAIDKGYTLVQLENPRVSHIGAQTLNYGPEREAITIANREKFRKKWNLEYES